MEQSTCTRRSYPLSFGSCSIHIDSTTKTHLSRVTRHNLSSTRWRNPGHRRSLTHKFVRHLTPLLTPLLFEVLTYRTPLLCATVHVFLLTRLLWYPVATRVSLASPERRSYSGGNRRAQEVCIALSFVAVTFQLEDPLCFSQEL